MQEIQSYANINVMPPQTHRKVGCFEVSKFFLYMLSIEIGACLLQGMFDILLHYQTPFKTLPVLGIGP